MEHHTRPSKENQKWMPIVIIGILAIIALQVKGLNNSLATLNDNIIDLKTEISNIQPSAPSAAAPSAPSLDMVKLMDDDAVKGNADAPVTIVEFSDYECPFCARFYKETYGQIEENYINTGKVKLIFRDFPLSFHQNAQKAAEAAECAGDQNKYYEMHNLLFGSGVVGGVTTFKQYAKDLGLDTNTFNTCLDSGKYVEEIKKDMSDGQAAGITGTPGFIINGVAIKGAQPYSVFKTAIDQALAE